MNTKTKSILPRPLYWFFNGVALLITAAFIEFKMLQIFRSLVGDFKLFYEYANILIPLLPIPFVAFVFIPLLRRLNRIASARPIFIRIEKNIVFGTRLDRSSITSECAGEFSKDNELIADIDKLTESVATVIAGCTKDQKPFALAPYVVFTANKAMSQVQRQAADCAIRRAGALVARYAEGCLSEGKARQFALENPISLLL